MGQFSWPPNLEAQFSLIFLGDEKDFRLAISKPIRVQEMFEQWTKNVAWNESTHDGGLQNIKQWVTLWLSWEVMNTRGWRRHGFWVGCTFYDIQLQKY